MGTPDRVRFQYNLVYRIGGLLGPYSLLDLQHVLRFGYLDFPHVGQVFLIECESVNKKTGEITDETVLGITSRTQQEASPKRVLAVNRGHWSIESVHYIIDWNLR